MPFAAPTHNPFPSPSKLGEVGRSCASEGRSCASERRSPRSDQVYSCARWRRLRAWFLSRAPLCADPYGDHKREGRAELATEVDHVIGRRKRPDLAWDPGNLQGLCKSCHSRKTREEGH